MVIVTKVAGAILKAASVIALAASLSLAAFTPAGAQVPPASPPQQAAPPPLQSGPAPSYARPSYAAQEEKISGRISSMPGKYDLELRDSRGYIDRVRLHDGTVINPTGLRLAVGMSIQVSGVNRGAVLEANEIDSPYTIDPGFSVAPVPAYPGYWAYGPYPAYWGYAPYPYYFGYSPFYRPYFGVGIGYGWGRPYGGWWGRRGWGWR